MENNHLVCTVKFITNEIVEDPNKIPDYKIDYTGVLITITGLDTNYTATIGRSRVKRSVTPKKYTEKIPAPYFVKFKPVPADPIASHLIDMIVRNNISDFSISNGTLICEIFSEQVDVSTILKDIEKVIKMWE